MSPPTLKRLNSADRDISPPPTKRRIISTTSITAVSNFFKPTSQKQSEPTQLTHSIISDSLLITRFQNPASHQYPQPLKLAAFDLDDTLITTKSGNRFSKGPDDWKWWHASVPSRLKQLHAEGYALVVLSNQAAVSLRTDAKAGGKAPPGGMLSLNNFKKKVGAVLSALDLPVSVYAATTHDLFRKPRTGMWERLVRDYGVGEGQEGGGVEHAKCLFVGDAAGREADRSTGAKKDHSCSDRNFAENVGIAFHTPEEYFLGEAVRPFVQLFDPAWYVDVKASTEMSSPAVLFAKKHPVEIVLFCGSPGAGKSTFYWNQLKPLGFERVNQDMLKTRERCVKVAREFIADGNAVAVDNTNADPDTRAIWVELSKKLGVPIRLVHFTSPAKLCEHNDTVRALSGDLMNPEKRIMLPKMAFTGFAGRYREPQLAEGFEEIIKVDFTFNGTKEQEAIWKKHWIS